MWAQYCFLVVFQNVFGHTGSETAFGDKIANILRTSHKVLITLKLKVTREREREKK
jgi:hypothetical protein